MVVGGRGHEEDDGSRGKGREGGLILSGGVCILSA